MKKLLLFIVLILIPGSILLLGMYMLFKRLYTSEAPAEGYLSEADQSFSNQNDTPILK